MTSLNPFNCQNIAKVRPIAGFVAVEQPVADLIDLGGGQRTLSYDHHGRWKQFRFGYDLELLSQCRPESAW